MVVTSIKTPLQTPRMIEAQKQLILLQPNLYAYNVCQTGTVRFFQAQTMKNKRFYEKKTG